MAGAGAQRGAQFSAPTAGCVAALLRPRGPAALRPLHPGAGGRPGATGCGRAGAPGASGAEHAGGRGRSVRHAPACAGRGYAVRRAGARHGPGQWLGGGLGGTRPPGRPLATGRPGRGLRGRLDPALARWAGGASQCRACAVGPAGRAVGLPGRGVVDGTAHAGGPGAAPERGRGRQLLARTPPPRTAARGLCPLRARRRGRCPGGRRCPAATAWRAPCADTAVL